MSSVRDHSAIKFVRETHPLFKVSLSTAYRYEFPLIVPSVMHMLTVEICRAWRILFLMN